MDIIRKMKEKATAETNANGGLTDEQRDEVRALLGKYVRPAKRRQDKEFVPDALPSTFPCALEMRASIGSYAKHGFVSCHFCWMKLRRHPNTLQ